MLKKLTKILLLALLSLVSVSKPVMAQYYQPSENLKEVVLDKQIKLDENYVDNIAASQKVFVEREDVTFRVRVSNTGNENLSNLEVVDYLPSYLVVVLNPGTYNQEDNSIRWNIESLAAGESKDYEIRARVAVNNYSYEVGQCNFSEVRVDGLYDSDKACYFIMGKTMPVTGANPLVIGSVFASLSLVFGVGLRKYSRGY